MEKTSGSISAAHPKVAPELQRIAKIVPRITFTRKNLWLWRSLDHWSWKRRIPGDLVIENLSIPAQDAEATLRLRVYRPKSLTAPAPVLLWMHGGGYIIGSPEQDDPSCSQYVRELGIVVASVDYRRAPEHPFPTSLEDCDTALTWVAAHPERLGSDATRIAVGGASAGGGLAAALVQLAHDRKTIQPRLQLLVYPMLDDRTALRTDIDDTNMVWNQKSNRFGWEAYLGAAYGTQDVPAYAAPPRRADVAGLPPAWIGVGTQDLFYDEDVAYAQRLKDSGVACELYSVPGAFHGFDVAGTRFQVVRDFRQAQIAALRKYLLP